MVVFRMRFQMFRQLADAFGDYRNLDLVRTRILRVQRMFDDNFLFIFSSHTSLIVTKDSGIINSEYELPPHYSRCMAFHS